MARRFEGFIEIWCQDVQLRQSDRKQDVQKFLRCEDHTSGCGPLGIEWHWPVTATPINIEVHTPIRLGPESKESGTKKEVCTCRAKHWAVVQPELTLEIKKSTSHLLGTRWVLASMNLWFLRTWCFIHLVTVTYPKQGWSYAWPSPKTGSNTLWISRSPPATPEVRMAGASWWDPQLWINGFRHVSLLKKPWRLP